MLLDDLRSDVRYAIRQLVRAPAFSAVAICVLAAGIGVNSAMFSFLDTVLFRPMPGTAPNGELVQIRAERGQRFSMPFTYNEYLELLERQSVFEDIAASVEHEVVLDIDRDPTPERAKFVGGGFFPALRPQLALGSGLGQAHDRSARPDPVIVISHGLWQSRFGGEPSVIGRIVRVNRVPLTVVGVMGERFPDDRLWIPLATRPLVLADSSSAERAGDLGRTSMRTLIGSLRSGVSVEQADAQVNAIARGIGSAGGSRSPLIGASVQSYRIASVSEIIGVTAFFGNVTLAILAIACANVSVLLLGRAVGRQREIAVRLALGAARRRIIRQLMTEGVLLAVAAGITSLVVLDWLGELIRTRFTEVGLDFAPNWRTVAITIGFASITGLLFALVPALHASRTSVSETLKDSGSGQDPRSWRLQRTLVVAEVALSMALVCASGIFVQGMRQATSPDDGYEPTPRALRADLVMHLGNYSPARADALVTTALDRLGRLPGVVGVSSTDAFPGEHTWTFGRLARRDSTSTFEDRDRIALGHADPAFFSTIGMNVRGREFMNGDISGRAPVAIVDEQLANALWPGRNPLGQPLRYHRLVLAGDGPAEWPLHEATVVGVVRYIPGGMDLPRIYIPRRQDPLVSAVTLVVRSTANAAPLIPLVRQELWRIDPDLPIRRTETLDQARKTRHTEAREVGFAASLAGSFALVLACIGVFAVIAFAIARRVREIAVRRALGASDRQVVALFFRDAMRLVMGGFAIGVPLGLAVMKVAVSNAYGVELLSARSVGSVIGLLLAVAAFASWLPARRAVRVNPIDALRQD